MSLFLNAQEPVFNSQETVFSTQETIVRYGEYIEKFRDAFKSCDIPFGSPNDFFAFCEILKIDFPLRTDLAKLTKSLLARENNNISIRTLLTVIAISSGGREIITSQRDMSKPINTLIGFLTNAVGCRRLDPRQLDTICIATSTAESASEADPISNNDDTPSALPHDNCEDFKQFISRLDLNALEKMQLDAIVQRISRKEPPRLENVSPVATFTPTAIDESEPEPADVILRPSEPRGIPLQSYDDPAPFFFFGARVIIVFLLLGLAIFAGVYFYRHRSDAYLTRSYQYLQQRLSALRQPHTASTTATSPAETPVTPADSPIEIRPTPTPADSTPHLQPIVEVAASSMTGNLISAPKPTYPKLAQQNNTQGRVVLRATVSSDGNIQNIHGIKGPRLLQDAAVDAVSTWRYKPHLVHGKPMPVAILVTINFTLEPSPNNQQSKLTPSP